MKKNALQLNEILLNAGFSSLNTLQEEVLENKTQQNLVVIAHTGSGKTLAYLLPMAMTLNPNSSGIQALILSPSRELALQIESVFRSFKSNFKVLTCYGGHSMRSEKNSLLESPAVLIGTPGRICDHLANNNLDITNVSSFILDEYDKCLEFGFGEQMEYICQSINKSAKKILVSATKIAEIPAYLQFNNFVEVDFSDHEKQPDIQFFKVPTQESKIIDDLTKLLSSFSGDQCILFCNYREKTEELSKVLADKGFEVVAYHGGMEQEERERALIKFRNNSKLVLICTDLGARGLDIPEIKHVVHYQFPQDEKSFLHRNGRTARMHAHGSVYLMLNQDEKQPEYIPVDYPKVNLPTQIKPITTSEWTTIYLSAGKKNKINKIDIVGFFMQIGKLRKEEIGLIIVLDYTSYVAVKKSAVKELLIEIKDKKIKGQKLKIAIAR